MRFVGGAEHSAQHIVRSWRLRGLCLVHGPFGGWHDDSHYQPVEPDGVNDIPESEARTILAQRRVCDDPPDWREVATPRDTSQIVCGLVDEEGKRTGLYVSFVYRRSAKTGIEKYVFSVMRQTLGGVERVYQLEVEKFKVCPRDGHALPHEHIGGFRSEGTRDWCAWSYAQVLDRFCAKANIEIRPLGVPRDPTEFVLRG